MIPGAGLILFVLGVVSGVAFYKKDSPVVIISILGILLPTTVIIFTLGVMEIIYASCP